MREVFTCLASVIGFLVSIPSFANAQDQPFYAGKQIQFIIQSGAGSGYDLYSRLIGRYISRHIPGAPVVLPVNMPGAGGVIAANYVAVKAPRDGTTLTMVGQGLPLDQALGSDKGLQADLKTFNWVGNINHSNQLIITWKTSPIQTMKDAIDKRSNFGAVAIGNINSQVPAMLNSLAGTQFKIVLGYPTSGDMLLAMERGEIDSTLLTWASVKSTRPDYVSKNLINIIAQVGIEKDPQLPDVPLMRDFARREQDKAALDYLSKSVVVGRPVATTPGVPEDRVQILRKAFDDMLQDPDFIRDAAQQNLEIAPMNGKELQKIVKELIEAPPDVLESVREAIQMSP
jgi:tripartite-type tricarboxylate transporter receptor subunit TctC